MTAAPRLLAGLMPVPVTGMVARWTMNTANPMGSGASTWGIHKSTRTQANRLARPTTYKLGTNQSCTRLLIISEKKKNPPFIFHNHKQFRHKVRHIATLGAEHLPVLDKMRGHLSSGQRRHGMFPSL